MSVGAIRPVSKGMTMARKPNYEFERRERDRQRAEKKAARAAAKKDAKLAKNQDDDPSIASDQPDSADC